MNTNIIWYSKFLELLDTFVFLLSGRPVIFLHYYHHSTVLLHSWTFIRGNFPFFLTGVLFNTFVHIIMYTYYAFSLYIRNIPYKRAITYLQIIQFMTSFILFIAYLYYTYPVLPNVPGFGAHIFCLILNFTYFLLFVRLATAKPPPSSSSKSQREKSA